jgi:hypothetical protein
LLFRKVLAQELKGHNNQSEFTRFVVQKWKKLSDEVYHKARLDINEYYAYRTSPPAYQLIKF